MFFAYYHDDAAPYTPHVWLRFPEASTDFAEHGLRAFISVLDGTPSGYKVLAMALPSD